MAIFKCKMCGADLEITGGSTIAKCKYCGTNQTVPRLDTDEKEALYERANHFRRNNEYDIAMSIYEQILSVDKTDAEAYWSLMLCRYGIEYVEEGGIEKKRVPTVNRAQFTSVFDDEDYKLALAYADSLQREIYINEAKVIDEIQKGILAISQKEKPFDIFICYKETDVNGKRTIDSAIAYDLYKQLTDEGYKVFFARVTLEDKLGIAYEPYIFAALNSAKVMFVVGTKPEYFNAIWVKNEWSRYIAIIKKDSKKVLIPCYRDMSPYDLPKEFLHLQAQDMSKIGAVQDIIRGVSKIIPKKSESTDNLAANATSNSGLEELFLTNAFISLKSSDYNVAAEYVNKVLDIDSECADAYMARLMIDLKLNKPEDFAEVAINFGTNPNYVKLMQYCDEATAITFKKYLEAANQKKINLEKKKRKKRRTTVAVLTSIVIGVIAAVISYVLFNPYGVIAKSRFDEAISMFENENYTECMETLSDLKDYGFEGVNNKLLNEIVEESYLAGYGEEALNFATKFQLPIKKALSAALEGSISEAIQEGLQVVAVKDGTLSINDYDFSDCFTLRKIKIPNSVTSIGEGAFLGCTGLTSIEIPNSVTSIGEGAFSGCTGLTSIEIPSSVTSIGAGAFGGCSGLTSIEIQNGVTSIEEDAFFECWRLTSVEIPNSVTIIGERAFWGCSGLTNVEIPSSVISIEEAFNGCSGLESINVSSENNVYASFNGILCDKDLTKIIQVPMGITGEIVLPSSISTISSFEGCSKITSIVLSDNVKSILAHAFYGCAGLESIVIPNSVKSIGSSAFGSCNNLKNVYYKGTSSEWNDVKIGFNNECVIYYYSATKPSSSGNYWRYVNDVPTPW